MADVAPRGEDVQVLANAPWTVRDVPWGGCRPHCVDQANPRAGRGVPRCASIPGGDHLQPVPAREKEAEFDRTEEIAQGEAAHPVRVCRGIHDQCPLMGLHSTTQFNRPAKRRASVP